MADIKKQIDKILDEIRPNLQMDGGDVELESVKNGVVKLKIKGACYGCPMAQLTFGEGVGNLIKQKISSVKEVKYK